jgi:hypothetical protein
MAAKTIQSAIPMANAIADHCLRMNWPNTRGASDKLATSESCFESSARGVFPNSTIVV